MRLHAQADKKVAAIRTATGDANSAIVPRSRGDSYVNRLFRITQANR
jgi:hypothetical protein